MSRLVKWTIAGVVAVIALVTVGTYVFIHFIEGDAPAALDVRTETSAAAAPRPRRRERRRDHRYRRHVATDDDSIVGYRIKETLFGQNATAVGRTNDITGSLVIDGTTVKCASFTVDMTKVSSDKSQRDNQFQGRIMQTSQFPDRDVRVDVADRARFGARPGKVVSYKARAT